MTDTVLHIVGFVGTDIDHRQVGEGTDLSTFRLASTPRRWDKGQRQYVDGTTNWLTVQCWRALAVHVRDSLGRGDPVVVIGRLRTEEWTKDEVRQSRFYLDATTVGHDLTKGVSAFRKTTRPVESPTDEVAEAVKAMQQIEDAETLPGHEPKASGSAQPDVLKPAS